MSDRRRRLIAAIALAGLLALPRLAAADAAARGRYLAAAAGCGQCHTAEGGRPYAGGRRLETRWGVVVTPNITPDRATGIGAWSMADFTRAIRWGIAPDDTHYRPAFPFPFYSRLSGADLAALKAFLDSLPAVTQRNRSAGADLSTAPARAAIAVAAEPFPGPWRDDPAHDAEWNRGAYLVATIGRCGDCHTPRNRLGARERGRFLAGAADGPGRKAVPNITPDQASGIGKWSLQDIVALLTLGQTPDFDFVGGAMAEIVKNTAQLAPADRHAIAVYLKTIPAVPGRQRGSAANTR